MNQAKLEALLGRPLTTIEVDNLKLYLDIATDSLNDLLCTDICNSTDPRVYSTREGYRTVFTDIFTDVEEVKIDGEVIDPSKYSTHQWDARNADWYNSIVFEDRFTDCDPEIEVSANWGFSTYPADLQLVLAGLFDLIGRKKSYDATVSSKRVEDFQVTFNTGVDLDTEFVSTYARTLSKYSLCDIPNVQHGRVCHVSYRI